MEILSGKRVINWAFCHKGMEENNNNFSPIVLGSGFFKTQNSDKVLRMLDLRGKVLKMYFGKVSSSR